MSNLLAYIMGCITLPVAIAAGAVVRWCLSRNLGTECGNCGKVLGRIRVDRQLGTEIRWRYHYLRYWYLTRPNWTCNPHEEDQ